MILEVAILNVLPERTEEFERAFGEAQAIIASYPDIESQGARYPAVIDKTWEDVWGLRIPGPKLNVPA